MNNKSDMDLMHLDVLSEVGNIGAGNAASALSQLVDDRIDMYVPNVQTLTFSELAEIFGGAETLIVGIMVSLSEDIEGQMLFAVEYEQAKHLVSQIMKRETDSDVFSEIERSALMEIGNIIAGAYLRAISQLTNLTIGQSIPYMAVDMAGAILSVPAIEFGKVGDTTLLIESTFKEMERDISCYFVLIPTMESSDLILKSLGIR